MLKFRASTVGKGWHQKVGQNGGLFM